MSNIVQEARKELERGAVDFWGVKQFHLGGTHREIVVGLLGQIKELERLRALALEGKDILQGLAEGYVKERDAALEQVRALESQAKASKGLYRHEKTGGLYYVITEATLETTGELVVVYRSISDGHDWVRPADEFFDGRFVKIEDKNA